MKKKLKKPALLVMGGTFALFSLANPIMAQEIKNPLSAGKAEVKSDHMNQQEARYKKQHDDEVGNVKWNAGEDNNGDKDHDKQKGDDKAKEGQKKDDQQKKDDKDKKEKSGKEDELVTQVSNTVESGKGRITFTVPEGREPLDLEFICYKLTAAGKTVHSKVKGKYNSGRHTIDVDLPNDSAKYDLEISCQKSDDTRILLWKREARGEWKALLNDSASVTAITLKRLVVNAILIDKTTMKWNWLVKNPNTQSVTFSWKLEGTDKSETKTLAAGQELVFTAGQGASPKLLISVQGKQSYDMAVSAAAAESTNDQSSSGSNSTPSGGSASAGSGGSNGSSGSSSSDATSSSGSTGSSGSASGFSSGSAGMAVMPNSSGGSSSTPSGSTEDTGSDSAGGSSSAGGSTTAVSTPSGSQGSTSTSTPTPTPTTISAPSMLAGEQAEVSPASSSPAAVSANTTQSVNPLNQPSAAQLNRLPQTGERAPFGIYAAGTVLALIGSLLLRNRKTRH